MNKWISLAIVVFLALAIPIGYYLISPLFIEIEVQEESPFERSQVIDTEIKDNLDIRMFKQLIKTYFWLKYSGSFGYKLGKF